MTKKSCVIFDIDGTLADVEHRRHHLPDWNKFFSEMNRDPVKEDIVDLYDVLARDGHDIFICTGRGEEYRKVTEDWLNYEAGIGGFKDLLMRPANNSESDVIIKRRMLKDIQSRGYDVWFVVDDRQKVVDMWREEGITCLQCAPGDFDKHSVSRWRKPTLRILVGPSGAGKSSYVENMNNVVSSDMLRKELTGDFKCQDANKQVFEAMHAITEARLTNGLDTILDATHLRNKDRKKAVKIGLDCHAEIQYIIFDRPMVDKIKTGGWRNDVKVKDQPLMEYHANVFKSNLKDILSGDGFEEVVIVDLRTD